MGRRLKDRRIEAVVEQLKEIRLSKQLSHETLAKESGLTRPAISFIESGKRQPSLEVCFMLADALGVRLSKLILIAEREKWS